MGIDELVPDSIRPRHAEYRQGFAREPRARPMGKQTDLVARRKDGTEVVVEIALSPLQDHGHPLVVAAIRDIGAYPRMKQALLRAHYSEVLARVGRLAVDTRDPQVLLDRVPAAASEALQVEVAMVYLLEPSLLELRIAGGVGSMPGEAVGQRVANRPDTSLGFVLAQGRPIVVHDYRQETRFSVPEAYLKAGLISAVGVPLSDRGRTIGVLVVRSRVARSFGEDEVRFLESLANLLASSLQRAQSEEALNHASRLESVGSAHRRHRPRLQQPADGDPGQPAGAGRAAAATPTRCSAASSSMPPSAPRAAAPSSPASCSRFPAARCCSRSTWTPPRCCIRSPTCCGERSTSGSASRSRSRPAASRCAPTRVSSSRPCSTSRSMRATPCRAAARFASGPSSAPSCRRRSLPRSGAETPADRFVAIAIEDSGTGMTGEARERAFEPFFTTKEAGRGTGLGLSTVYGFARQSRGAVTLESTLGRGTTVTLYLPRPPTERSGAAARCRVGLRPCRRA